MAVAVEKTNFVFDKLFDYEVPVDLVSQIEIGILVVVPFGNSNCLRQAIILKIKETSNELNCKYLIEILTKKPIISVNLLKIVKFLHNNYFCSWFEAIRTVIPSGLFFKKIKIWKLNVNSLSINEFSEEELNLINFLKTVEANKGDLQLNCEVNFIKNSSSQKKIFNSFKKRGIIFQKIVFKSKIGSSKKTMVTVFKNNQKIDSLKLTKKQELLFNFIKANEPINFKEACYKCGVSEAVLKNLERIGLIKFTLETNEFVKYENLNLKNEFNLSESQLEVANGLIDLLKQNKPNTALLKGVTGSGKTRVFLKLISIVLNEKKQVILLVPEIVLTPQMVRFFKNFFGEVVSVLHSSLTVKQQLQEHMKIKNGFAKLVIGTRSAVFAPCENLGLIIMDEEGELTYKNSDVEPRYHAREVAIFRCEQFKSLLILSSATPSVETQYFAKIGRYHEFVLKHRFQNFPMAKVEIVDLKTANNSPIENISLPLFNELLINLKNKEQSIILLNRRGFDSGVLCLNCNNKVGCPNCSAILTYHSVNNKLICHYCGYMRDDVYVCENCGSENLIHFGNGTQKIEQHFIKFFSNARILRLDSDSVFGKTDLEKKIEKFEQNEYDILIGTQMIAKGLNFLNVTLVGIVSIDNMLYGSDFRCGEQMFSLLTQVVGRSGRGCKPGRAIVQTFNPTNSIILKAAEQNYDSFYEEEIDERKEFFCPPFCDLCIINFNSLNREKIKICAKKFIYICRDMASVKIPIKVLGIATPFIDKINKRYRNRIIIKCKNSLTFRLWIKSVMIKFVKEAKINDVRINIDMNGEIL